MKRKLRIAPLTFAGAPKFQQAMGNSPAMFRAYILGNAALVLGQLTRPSEGRWLSPWQGQGSFICRPKLLSP
jgi:hypothetical protein